MHRSIGYFSDCPSHLFIYREENKKSIDAAKFKNQRLLLLDDLDQDFTVITKRAIAIRNALNVTRPSRS